VRGTGRIRFFKIKINSLGWPRFSDKCAGPNRCCKRPTGPLRQRDEDFSSKNWSTARIALRHPGLNPGPVRGEGPRPNPILRVRRAAVTGHCRGPRWHEVCGEFSLQFREQGPGPVAPRGGTSDGPSPRRLRGQGSLPRSPVARGLRRVLTPVPGARPGPCGPARGHERRAQSEATEGPGVTAAVPGGTRSAASSHSSSGSKARALWPREGARATRTGPVRGD